MVWAEIAHWMALIPLAWMAGLAITGHRCDPAFWWIAAAFGVSWLADTAAHWLPGWAIGAVYPVLQGGIVAAVLLPRYKAVELLAMLALVGMIALVLRGARGPDIMIRTVAWLPLVWVAFRDWQLPTKLRACLIVYFGLGWLTWMIHAEWLVVATWYPYQAARLAGLLLFCWAALRCTRTFRVVT